MTTSATIRASIEHDIASGQLAPGDRLPSVRDLATTLEVSPNTVAAAYKQLRDRGVVLGRGRQGTIVAPATRPTSGQVNVVPSGLVDAMRGSPSPDLLPDLGPALSAAARGSHVRYGDVLLDPDFEAAVRRAYESDGIDATHLTATSGAMDAIARVLSANDLRPGDRVGVEDPGHVPVHQLVRSAGLIPVPLQLDAEGVRPESLEAALSIGLAAVIVTPRAQNPTGAAHSADRARALTAALADCPDVLLIQDDHAGPICGAPLHLIEPPGERFVHIRSYGKSLGPDLRISVTAGDAVTIDRVAISVSNGPGWVSHILQRAAAHLLDDRKAQASVKRAADTYRARRDRMVSALAAHGVEASAPSGLNVWIPVANEQAVVEAARQAGFAIRAADPYRITSGPAVRITISALDDAQIDALASAICGHLDMPRRAAAV